MNKILRIGAVAILLCGVVQIGLCGIQGETLSGVKTKAEIETLIAKLKSGELEGAQGLFEKTDGSYRVYTSYINNRKGSADLHALDDEIFLVVSGTAEITLGGNIIDKEAKSEHETRGTKVEGGKTYSVGAGDIISIPRGTAHQMNPRSGHILYIVIKIKGE